MNTTIESFLRYKYGGKIRYLRVKFFIRLPNVIENNCFYFPLSSLLEFKYCCFFAVPTSPEVLRKSHQKEILLCLAVPTSVKVLNKAQHKNLTQPGRQ